MSIFNRKKSEKLPPAEAPVEAGSPRVEAGSPRVEAGKQDPAPYRVMLKPHITEKSMRFADEGQYTFKVNKDVGKEDIKEAVEDIYKVNVASIRVINVRKKERRAGKTQGWRKGFKKAIVRIKKGQKIEFMPK